MIELTIDGATVKVDPGTTIWDAARDHGIEIPTLCHDPRMAPVGVCRMCVVDVGERTLAASCVRPCESGMEVRTATPGVESHRRTLTNLLMADQPPVDRDPKETSLGGNELLALASDGIRQLIDLQTAALGTRSSANETVAGNQELGKNP